MHTDIMQVVVDDTYVSVRNIMGCLGGESHDLATADLLLGDGDIHSALKVATWHYFNPAQEDPNSTN